ncbi:peptidyl-tRNA hydrolase 2, mitochondrial-like isoform X1 [Cloeon dipterum]|uniref:peptidyl-tRNA hydrolase 2, mitochondrial-like isoform X1 n=1 Tax=Cloeon dipterum TaxID=197152 RepID=UPI0032207274
MNEEASGGDSQQGWKPNIEFLQTLMGMGIERAAAETALKITGNQSAELAAGFLFDNEEDWGMASAAGGAGDDTVSQNRVQIDPLDDWTSAPPVEVVTDVIGDSSKMVFVINVELDMTPGKIAAQVAHASLALHRKLQYMCSAGTDILTQWEESGEKTVVLKCNNYPELKRIHEKADSMNVANCIIHDAGRTQVAPNSATVIGLFGSEKDLDEITGSLSLL